MLCGAVLVPIVHIYGVAEVGFILAQSGARVLIMPERFRTISYIPNAYRSFRASTPCGGSSWLTPRVMATLAWSQLQASGDYLRPKVSADAVCLMLYTSGHHIGSKRCAAQPQHGACRATNLARADRRGARRRVAGDLPAGAHRRRREHVAAADVGRAHRGSWTDGIPSARVELGPRVPCHVHGGCAHFTFRTSWIWVGRV